MKMCSDERLVFVVMNHEEIIADLLTGINRSIRHWANQIKGFQPITPPKPRKGNALTLC